MNPAIIAKIRAAYDAIGKIVPITKEDISLKGDARAYLADVLRMMEDDRRHAEAEQIPLGGK